MAINFVLKDGAVKFEMSEKALKEARIKVGSQLLKLAILVDGEKETRRAMNFQEPVHQEKAHPSAALVVFTVLVLYSAFHFLNDARIYRDAIRTKLVSMAEHAGLQLRRRLEFPGPPRTPPGR